MSYTKHNFQSGTRLYASQLNDIDNEISKLADSVDKISTGHIYDWQKGYVDRSGHIYEDDGHAITKALNDILTDGDEVTLRIHEDQQHPDATRMMWVSVFMDPEYTTLDAQNPHLPYFPTGTGDTAFVMEVTFVYRADRYYVVTIGNNSYEPFDMVASGYPELMDVIYTSQMVKQKEFNTLKQDVASQNEEITKQWETLEDHGQRITALEQVYVTPEMYGAVGDGVTDDSDAIISALNSGNIVKFDSKEYAVSKRLEGSCISLYGNNATIKILNDVDNLFVLPHAAEVSGFSFNLNGMGITCAVSVSHANDVDISNITVYDLYDRRSDKGTVLINCVGNSTVHIHDIAIRDCKHVGNGSITDTKGNVTGIYVDDYAESCFIDNISVVEIHNVDVDGNIVLEDGGGIYVHNASNDSPLFISNVYGRNYCKRLIKTQILGNVHVTRVNSYSNSEDHLVAIGIQNTETTGQEEAGTASITDCTLVNEYYSKQQRQYLVASSERISISNCIIKSMHQIAILVNGNVDIKGCRFDGYGMLISEPNTTIRVSDSVFSGKTVVASNADRNLCDVEFDTCKFQWLDYENNISLQFFDTRSAESRTRITNCVFDSGSVLMRDNTLLYNSVFKNSGIDCITVNGKNCVIDGVEISSREGSYARAINVYANAEATIRNTTVHLLNNGNGYSFGVIGSGVVNIGQNNYPFGFYKGITIGNVIPQYVSSLPLPNLRPEGALVIATTSGKLYKVSGGEWVAVT